MTRTNPNNYEANVPQHIRKNYAHQLRSEFLASMYKTFRDTVRRLFTHSVNEVRVYPERVHPEA